MLYAFSHRQRQAIPFLMGGVALAIALFVALGWSVQDAAAQEHVHEAQAAPASLSAGTAHVFHAALSGANEVPAKASRASGYAVLALGDDMATLSYRVFTSDIVSVTAAHIHQGAPGENGDIVIPIALGAGGVMSGTAVLSPTQVAELLAGNYYVNVHTEQNPGGEIRGQIEAFTPPTAYSALLTGGEEIPPVETDDVGVARFTLVNTDTLTYVIAVSNTNVISLAHIHKAPTGVNGPVIHTLYTGTTPFDPDNAISGTVELDAQGMVDLLTGYYYVNAHTPEHPAGEMRGQIRTAHLFGAALDGNQEAPNPVDTLAYGSGVMALDGAATSLAYRITVTGILTITNQHFHRAPRGQPGPVDVQLPPFGDDNVISGVAALDNGHIFRLIGGNWYVNVHSQDNPPGEIRGQVEPLTAPADFNALLTSEEEVPPVDADAAGFSRLKLRQEIGVLNYYVAVTNTTSAVTLAHIHQAPTGVNGPPIADLLALGGGPLAPNSPVAGAVPMDAQKLVDLLTGYHYVNVHTDNNGAGEMRGQVGAARTFFASLDGVQETPPNQTNAFGNAILALSADTAVLYYRVAIHGIETATAAHIHRGAVGIPGPVELDLKRNRPFGEGQPISGTLVLTDANILRLVSGDYYVNVHTSALPGGEVRGQVHPYTPATHWNALLGGANEAPPVETQAAGVARLYLHALSNSLHYHIAVSNTVDISMAHIHKAPVGVNGSVVINLLPANTVFDNNTPLIGNVLLDGQALVDMLSGYHYVNVHTSTNPGGEIRGQVGGARIYQAVLNGANERPDPVTTGATGRAVLALSADATQLSFRVMVQDIVSITLAHIHRGSAEEAGPVVFDLKKASPFSVDQPISGTVLLDTGDLQDLAAGKFYVNVHTQSNPGGEIRGQVEPYSPPGNFQVFLNEVEEIAPAAVAALGEAAFQLNLYPAALLQYAIHVADIENIILAHIHKGVRGVNGPVVFNFDPPATFGPGRPISGFFELDQQNLVDLLTGYYYVNIHTQEAPSGKIRGQVNVDGALYHFFFPVVITDEETGHQHE